MPVPRPRCLEVTERGSRYAVREHRPCIRAYHVGFGPVSVTTAGARAPEYHDAIETCREAVKTCSLYTIISTSSSSDHISRRFSIWCTVHRSKGRALLEATPRALITFISLHPLEIPIAIVLSTLWWGVFRHLGHEALQRRARPFVSVNASLKMSNAG